MVLFASCACIGLAVSLLVYQLVRSDAASGSSSSLRGVDVGEHLNLHEVLLARSRSERVVQPWVRKLAVVFDAATPSGRLDLLIQTASTAGLASQWPARRIARARTLCLVAGVVFGFLFFGRIGGGLGLLMGVLAIGIGWRGFDVFLINRARIRQERISLDLPDIADQIAISTLAGLSFEQAIRRTVESMDGPLADEFTRFLHDVRVGQTRQNAFRRLQERVDVPDVTSFVRSIAQAERSGVPISEILQIQADELRERRKQRAEERAMKLPVLMLLPLVTCVLPALMLVLLGPAILKLVENGFG